MDCCCQGHALAPRHWTWGAALTSVNAMLAGEVGARGGTAAAQAARRPLLRSTFCASPSRSMSIRMAARPGSREKRRRTTTTSRAPCGRDRLRWHTWPTCRTVPSLPGIRQAFSPRCAPPSRDSSTRTISIVQLGWMRWSQIIVCIVPFPPPISRRRTEPREFIIYLFRSGRGI